MRLHPALALLLLIPAALAPGGAALAPGCLDAPLADACASAGREPSGNLTASAEAEGAVPIVVAWERRANATLDPEGVVLNASTNGTNPLNARPLGLDVGVSRSGVSLRGWTCTYYFNVVVGPCHDPTKLPGPPAGAPHPDPEPLLDGAGALADQLVCLRPRPHLCLLPL